MSLLPVDEAIARVIGGVERLPAENAPLAEATGRVLAEPLAATRDQPPFPAAAMDGYAVRAADALVGARLKLIGMSAAGYRFSGAVGPGEAVRIFTGAPVPDAADAILVQENAEAAGDAILVREAPLVGRHIRARSFDFAGGDVLIDAGRKLGARDIMIAASMGHAFVPVVRRPKVAILATGDELVAPSQTPGPDQIFASNALGLAALIAAAGGTALDLGIAPDRREAIGDAIDAAPHGTDILVTIGGASVGEHDLVRQTLTARGMALDFWRIAMRPGKPLMFGRLGAMRVLGLPGNPVSSFVCAILFLTPLIAALLGQAYRDPSEPAVAGTDLPANDARQDYLRAALIDRPGALPVATPFPFQDSSNFSALAKSDCLLIRAPNAPAAPAGASCRIIRI
jgi:molybdopterin molybdotransferase